MTDSAAALEVVDVTVRFGGLVAVSEVSFDIQRGEVMGLVGPNGAGKSTLFNAVTGVVKASSGSVAIFGRNVTTLPTHRRMRRGVARTFQLGGLVPGLTVLENVVLGVDHRMRSHGSGRRSDGTSPRHRVAAATEVLERLGLAEVAGTNARSLGSGTQRIVEVARCVASGAELMLLDEPGVGLTPDEREKLKSLVRTVSESGSAVLITDHDTDIVFSVSDRVVAMDRGARIAFGPAAAVRSDPAVQAAYLGTVDTEDSTEDQIEEAAP